MKAKVLKGTTERPEILMIQCPGCNTEHRIWVNEGSPKWEWNGSFDEPTFTPSLRVDMGNGHICHSNITDGKITYFEDSTHPLAGKQNIDLPKYQK